MSDASFALTTVRVFNGFHLTSCDTTGYLCGTSFYFSTSPLDDMMFILAKKLPTQPSLLLGPLQPMIEIPFSWFRKKGTLALWSFVAIAQHVTLGGFCSIVGNDNFKPEPFHHGCSVDPTPMQSLPNSVVAVLFATCTSTVFLFYMTLSLHCGHSRRSLRAAPGLVLRTGVCTGLLALFGGKGELVGQEHVQISNMHAPQSLVIEPQYDKYRVRNVETLFHSTAGGLHSSTELAV
ncbi:hypothetical protein V8B97DRAFT_1913555 [Scleroderma yunnanense]